MYRRSSNTWFYTGLYTHLADHYCETVYALLYSYSAVCLRIGIQGPSEIDCVPIAQLHVDPYSVNYWIMKEVCQSVSQSVSRMHYINIFSS